VQHIDVLPVLLCFPKFVSEEAAAQITNFGSGAREQAMSNRFKALLGAGVLLFGPVLVLAQTPAPSTQMAPAQKDAPIVSSERTINLTEENRYTIREVVLKDPNVAKEKGPPAAIGDSLPSGVSTQPFPAEVAQKIPALRSHRFFVTDQEVVIVDPKSNKVADIVKSQ
jgi:hypothetical protein